ncbi:MAG: ATP-dependent metallopeptidase FtsH/Yme1/Tma family protein, partial [Patescibacteria group bacterium]
MKPRLPKPKMKKFELRFHFNLRTLLLILLILFFTVPFFFSLSGVRQGTEEIALSTALGDIKERKVEKVHIEQDRVSLTYKDGVARVAFKESNESFGQILKNADIDPSTVSYTVADQTFSRIWVDILGILLPVGLMVLFFLFIFRQARGAQESLFSFGQSRARLFAKGKQSVTFKDVAGVDEAKKELEEVVDFLNNPGKYRAMGARTPKGVLLFGPSGVGKTLLARAFAGEAGVPF